MWIMLFTPIHAVHDAVRRRPDLPVRAGHGFFLNDKYVSDDDLWRYFSEYSNVRSGSNTVSTPKNGVQGSVDTSEFERVRKSVHTTALRRPPSLPACCVDSTAECLSCQQGVTLDAYCQSFPFVTGCGPELIMLYENEND